MSPKHAPLPKASFLPFGPFERRLNDTIRSTDTRPNDTTPIPLATSGQHDGNSHPLAHHRRASANGLRDVDGTNWFMDLDEDPTDADPDAG